MKCLSTRRARTNVLRHENVIHLHEIGILPSKNRPHRSFHPKTAPQVLDLARSCAFFSQRSAKILFPQPQTQSCRHASFYILQSAFRTAKGPAISHVSSNFAFHFSHPFCSADFQSAVSRVSNL